MTSQNVTNSVSTSSISTGGSKWEHFVHVLENGVRKTLGPFGREEQQRVAQAECLRLDVRNRLFAPIK